MAFYKSNVSKCSDEEFARIISESQTYKEALSKLGYHHSGGAYATLRKRIQELNLSVEHMTPAARYGKRREKIPNNEVFIKDYKGGVKVRRRVLKGELIPYCCAICGQEAEWHGLPLTLTLDHINGDHYDNRLENLRFLCPNCDSQQPTYGAKNKHGYGSNFNAPSKKAKKQVKKEPKVSKEEFMKELITFKSFVEMGKRFKVSDNAVRRWCKKWNLPVLTAEMKHFVSSLKLRNN